MWMMTVENYEDMFDIDGTCGITTPSPREVLQRNVECKYSNDK